MSETWTWIVLVLVLVVFVGEWVCWFLASKHKGSVEDRAWQIAGVDRGYWMVYDWHNWLPFSNQYYLLVIRPRLDRATQKLADFEAGQRPRPVAETKARPATDLTEIRPMKPLDGH